MKTPGYKITELNFNGDIWHIHYLRLDETTVKITCDLLRPNRKFWQSKFLWSDWTGCSAKNANLLESMAYDIINNYYNQRAQINKFNEFFENTY